MYFEIKSVNKYSKRVAIIAGIGSVALLLGACSAGGATSGGTTTQSSGAPSSGVPQTVIDELATYSSASKVNYEGKAIDVSSVGGKTVWWVTQYSGNPFLATVGSNFKQAMSLIGVKVTECDGKGNPVDANNCLRQAVAQKAAAIQMDGPEPATYANALPEANAAKIPVLNGAGIDASVPLMSGMAGQSSQPFGFTGKLAADWIINDSKGAANVLFITTPDVVGSNTEEKDFSARMAETCPNCKVTVKGVTLANWASDLGPTTSAVLVKDPTINYVVPTFDPITQFVNPAIQQTGKSSTVKVVSVNGNLAFMQDMASPNSLTKALIGIDLHALGYIEADQMLRAMTGNTPIKLAYAPVRVFDSSTVGKLALTAKAANDSSWYAGTDATSKMFAALWKQG